MGLDNKHQVFLSQEDHDEEDSKQFQTKSGESFDFKQGYDTAVYEVHKQYKLRSRTVNATQPEKAKDRLQPKSAIVIEPTNTTDSPSKEIIIEDITEQTPNSPATSFEHSNPSKGPQEVMDKHKPQNQEETLPNKERGLIHST